MIYLYYKCQTIGNSFTKILGRVKASLEGDTLTIAAEDHAKAWKKAQNNIFANEIIYISDFKVIDTDGNYHSSTAHPVDWLGNLIEK